ncbi:MAG: hypothetical protein RR334_03385 [Clostridia bacterium]
MTNLFTKVMQSFLANGAGGGVDPTAGADKFDFGTAIMGFFGGLWNVIGDWIMSLVYSIIKLS